MVTNCSTECTLWEIQTTCDGKNLFFDLAVGKLQCCETCDCQYCCFREAWCLKSQTASTWKLTSHCSNLYPGCLLRYWANTSPLFWLRVPWQDSRSPSHVTINPPYQLPSHYKMSRGGDTILSLPKWRSKIPEGFTQGLTSSGKISCLFELYRQRNVLSPIWRSCILEGYSNQPFSSVVYKEQQYLRIVK